jgi:hypothetical protein
MNWGQGGSDAAGVGTDGVEGGVWGRALRQREWVGQHSVHGQMSLELGAVRVATAGRGVWREEVGKGGRLHTYSKHGEMPLGRC